MNAIEYSLPCSEKRQSVAIEPAASSAAAAVKSFMNFLRQNLSESEYSLIFSHFVKLNTFVVDLKRSDGLSLLNDMSKPEYSTLQTLCLQLVECCTKISSQSRRLTQGKLYPSMKYNDSKVIKI
mmetsp:Transcript_241/g.420  ORF Transcript_241/g.420 Transcript_241/m.420 type:complete len:124 (+) Transcript_241:175-546(+)